jgi:hypothetical protein
MKTFEEKFNAWLDGLLSGEELKSFENEHPSIRRDRAGLLKLQNLLREHLRSRELENPDFFNSQIMAQVKRETPEPVRPSRRISLGLPRIVWAGIFALSLGFALFFTMIPRGNLGDPGSGYVAEVLKTKTTGPKVKTTVDNKKDMTIIKLEGLDKLPPDKDLNRN